MFSYWEYDSFFRQADVAVVGGGIVGLHAAICLKERAPALRVLLIERGALPLGASTKNAGFACFGSMSELLADRASLGEERLLALVERRWLGLQRLLARLGRAALHYEALGGYELFRAEDAEIYAQCREEMARMNRLLAPIIGEGQVFRGADEKIGPFGLGKTEHLIHNVAEGQLHPGWMMEALARQARERGVSLLYGLEIEEILPDEGEVLLRLAGGEMLRLPQVLVCTNGFARQVLPGLPVQPARNQVLITSPLEGLPLAGAFHYHEGYVYFRNVGQRLLLGGGRHLDPSGEGTAQFGQTPLIQDYLRAFLAEVLLPGRDCRIERWWSGILGLGAEKEPVLRRVHPRVGVAVRMGGMGVAIGSLVGEQGAELMLEGL